MSWRPRARWLAIAALSVMALAGRAGTAAADDAGDRPRTGHLVAAGIAMAPAVYVIGVTAHEGSHALAALALGLEVRTVRLYPGIHPRTGHFYFGWVDVRGIETTAERVAFLVAPKVTDAVMLGAYAGLVLSGAVPDNRYGQLAMAAMATGFWVDFSRDAIAWWPHNDTVRAYGAVGLRGFWRQLPARLLHAGAAAAAAIPIAIGYRDVFARGEAATLIVPLWQNGF